MAIRNKGSKFQVDVTVKGVRAPRTSADTMAEARAIEARYKAHLMNGGDPAELGHVPSGKTSAPTLGELLELTYKEAWRGTKSEHKSVANAQVWLDSLGADFPLTELNRLKVNEVVDELHAKGNAGATINRKLAALGKMLTVGDENGLISKFKLPRKKEYEGRLRYFTDEEVDSLIDMAEGDVKRMFILALETGLRLEELRGLIKRDYDTKRGLLLLGETKGNVVASVPVTNRAKGVLEELCSNKMDHEHLLPRNLTSKKLNTVIKIWKAARGLPDDDEAVFHTFRHTCCTRLVQEAVPLPVVQKWMRHAHITTTMGYAHLGPNSLEVALAALNERNAA